MAKYAWDSAGYQADPHLDTLPGGGAGGHQGPCRLQVAAHRRMIRWADTEVVPEQMEWRLSRIEKPTKHDGAAVVPAGPGALQEAAEILARDGLVVFPTDTVYGVGARLDRPAGLARLYAAKGRPAEKAIPVLVAGAEHLARLTRDLPPGAAAFAARFWPGALTIVLPRSDAVPDLVTAGGDTVGLRMPDHPFALDLITRCGGALAVTSANRSGEPSLAATSSRSRCRRCPTSRRPAGSSGATTRPMRCSTKWRRVCAR